MQDSDSKMCAHFAISHQAHYTHEAHGTLGKNIPQSGMAPECWHWSGLTLSSLVQVFSLRLWRDFLRIVEPVTVFQVRIYEKTKEEKFLHKSLGICLRDAVFASEKYVSRMINVLCISKKVLTESLKSIGT